MRYFIILLSVFCLAGTTKKESDESDDPEGGTGVLDRAFYVPIPDLASQPVLYGIDPKVADKFWDNWHLVTTRFRMDNNQQRYVFANPIAWKALQDHATEFPEGSMFGKIAFQAESDPNFPVSMTPNDFVRIQLMKKDKKAYADTNGWGYALYARDAEWPTDMQKQKNLVQRCHACHTLVAKRDYIFAEPVFLQGQGHATPRGASDSSFEKSFTKVSYSSLSDFEKSAIQTVADKPKEIKKRAMPLFRGSLGESTYSIAMVAAENNLPYLLVDEERQLYLATAPMKATKDCNTPVQVAVTMRKVGNTLVKLGRRGIKKGVYCNGEMNWDESGQDQDRRQRRRGPGQNRSQG